MHCIITVSHGNKVLLSYDNMIIVRIVFVSLYHDMFVDKIIDIFTVRERTNINKIIL